jgi:hypothetical protein
VCVSAATATVSWFETVLASLGMGVSCGMESLVGAGFPRTDVRSPRKLPAVSI